MNDMTKQNRMVRDRARDIWTVEEAGVIGDGIVVLRYRHELGYEIAATCQAQLEEMDDGDLERILEEARRRPPRQKVADAA